MRKFFLRGTLRDVPQSPVLRCQRVTDLGVSSDVFRDVSRHVGERYGSQLPVLSSIGSTLKFAEGIPSLPTIKLDGSGLVRYSEWIIENFDIAWIREYLRGDLYRELATHDSTRSCGHP